MIHELKTWSKFFNLIKSGDKPFELRKNDRGFLTGHELLLKEYNPKQRFIQAGHCTEKSPV